MGEVGEPAAARVRRKFRLPLAERSEASPDVESEPPFCQAIELSASFQLVLHELTVTPPIVLAPPTVFVTPPMAVVVPPTVVLPPVFPFQ
jgi:hypothetical protein